MRVLFLAENWPPRQGGIENYVTHIAHGLFTHTVSIVEPSTHRFFWPIIKPAWLPLCISLYFLAKKKKFDVTICGKALFEGLIGYYLWKHLKIPYVVLTYAMEIETWRENQWHNRSLQRVLKNASRVVYINDVTKQTLLNLGVTEKQLVKIWPGVDEKWFNTSIDTQSVLKKHNISQPFILAVARLIPRKGLDVLIEAFSKLDQTRFSNLHLVIVGEGPEKETLLKQIEHSWMNKSITLVGALSDHELQELYTLCEFFALTPKQLATDFEGFGIVYLEAGAHGKASLGTRTGGVSEAVVHKETGILVKPDSIPAIKEGLEYLLINTSERTTMGARAKKRAWEEFRWSKRILLVKAMLDAIITA